jgi:hypothetical protein
MNDPIEKLFREVSPPEGGLAKLRVRMEAEKRSAAARRRFRLAAVAAAGLVLLAVVPYVVFRGLPASPDRDLTRKVGAALVALKSRRAPSEPFELAAGDRSCAAALRVPTREPRVAFYFLATCADEIPAPGSGNGPPEAEGGDSGKSKSGR